jgi:hypothetical protein
MTELQYLDAGLGCAWDAALLEPLAELNAEILDAHAGTAASLSGQWQVLPAPARLRLACCPYLLADAGFARSELWVSPTRAGVHEVGPSAAPLEPRHANRIALATPLMRRVLVFAWHLARSRPLAARIALGMNSRCAAVIAGWRLADLEALAEQRPDWIRVRWDDRPELWRAWLRAAAQGVPPALERMQLWGLQSLAAAVVDPAP